MTVIYKTVI